MAKWHKIRARHLRSLWLEVLGNACAWAHKGNCRGKLTFDCIVPCGDKHHRMDTYSRMIFYQRQIRDHDNVQLLCEKHQTEKSRDELRNRPEEPF